MEQGEDSVNKTISKYRGLTLVSKEKPEGK